MKKQHAVDILNKLCKLDPEALRSILAMRVPFNKEIEQEPGLDNIIVGCADPDVLTLGPLGIIQGMLDSGEDKIIAHYNDDLTVLQYFS